MYNLRRLTNLLRKLSTIRELVEFRQKNKVTMRDTVADLSPISITAVRGSSDRHRRRKSKGENQKAHENRCWNGGTGGSGGVRNRNKPLRKSHRADSHTGSLVPIHRCSHPILFLSEPRQDIALKDSQSIGGYDYWRRMPVAGLKTPCHIQSSACLNCFATLEDRTSDMIRRLPSDRSARRLVGFGEFLSTSR